MKDKHRFPELPARSINRRAFLYGAGSVAIGLPFLESLQSRSAWAQGADPVFSLFVCTAHGVVANQFWPSSTGSLSGLSNDTGRATSILGAYADRLLIVRGVNYPGRLTSCGHAQGLAQVLTGATSSGSSNTATSTGPSADTVIAQAVNPGGREPLALYSGLKSGYINERLSFRSAGQVRSAEGNPYTAFQDLLRIADITPGGGPGPAPGPMVAEMLLRRKSVVDLVREELASLHQRAGLSQADRMRLDMHITTLRQVELDVTTIMEEAAPELACTDTLVDRAGIDAVRQSFRQNGMMEQVAKLHFDIAAFAFACNINRTASLQLGDGTDSTVYDVPSNSRRWGFHYVSHRTQSDAVSGVDATAERAHAEIDRVRMETFKYALDKFSQAGLLDNSYIYWTSHISDGPTHSFSNVPIIIAGSGGGKLKQGQYIDAGNVSNSRVLTTLINVAGGNVSNFGSGGGELSSLRA